jgi:hypothetical protein
MGIAATIAATVTGQRMNLPPALIAGYPELSEAQWRRGGMLVRIAGWFLGQRSVAAVTLWRTVWIAPDVGLSGELLLHELRHVHQFQTSATFPLRYLWETLRRGYFRNRFEVDARNYAAQRIEQTVASVASKLNG